MRRLLSLTNPVRVFKFLARKCFGTVYRFRVQGKYLAITFDDGPDPVDTPTVLDVLKAHNAKATFFMIGEAVVEYPDIVQRVIQEGHTVGHHTFTHVSMSNTPWNQRLQEFRNCKKHVRQYGKDFFRMPFGHQTIGSHLQARLTGFEVFGWTHKADDTRGLTAREMIALLEGNLESGDIVSFHDTVYHYRDPAHLDRGEMLAALAHVLSAYRDRGFEWVNMERMMEIGRPERTHWYRQHHANQFDDLTKKQIR